MQTKSLKYIVSVPAFLVILAGLVLGYWHYVGSAREYYSVSELGQFKLGERVPDIGYRMLYPKFDFPGPEPKFKFTIQIAAERMVFCSYANCGKYGEFVETMGGWLAGYDTWQPDIQEEYGLRLDDRVRPITSAIVISDQDSKVVGLYPNATMKDLLSILHRHPDLADFKLLEGVTESGLLKVGEPSPLQPGDSVTYRRASLDDFQTTTIPKDKNFYVFAIQKRFLTKGVPCTHLTCDYMAMELLWPINGWFMNDGEEKTARLFGLNPEKVREGKESLLVVMDSRGVIVALHPDKTLRDTLSILRQLPEIYKESTENP